MAACPADFDALTGAMKRCAAWLREADVEFLLAGSLAAWAHGGPPTCQDIDLLVRPADAERALAALAGRGLAPERPPEGWLLKARDGDVLVDLIFEPVALDVEAAFARAELVSVLSVDMAVMSVDDVVATKLLAFEEHYLDFEGLLPIVRALRERVDWPALRRRTAHNPYAVGFLAMCEALGLTARGAPADDLAARRIRVSTT